jgi:hypothetical protein
MPTDYAKRLGNSCRSARLYFGIGFVASVLGMLAVKAAFPQIKYGDPILYVFYGPPFAGIAYGFWSGYREKFGRCRACAADVTARKGIFRWFCDRCGERVELQPESNLSRTQLPKMNVSMGVKSSANKSGKGPNVIDALTLPLFMYRPRGKIGTIVFMAVILVGGLESVPGWEMFGLRISPTLYMALAITAGIFAGAVGAKFRLPGAICGGICGAGAAWIFSMFLSAIDRLPIILGTLALVAGCLPGFCAYWLADRVLSRNSTPKAPHWRD